MSRFDTPALDRREKSMAKRRATATQQQKGYAMNFRIHPAIGISRVGNSEEYVIAPEAMAGSRCRTDRTLTGVNRNYLYQLETRWPPVAVLAAPARANGRRSRRVTAFIANRGACRRPR